MVKCFGSSYKFYDEMSETGYFYLRGLFGHKVTFCLTVKCESSIRMFLRTDFIFKSVCKKNASKWSCVVDCCVYFMLFRP